MIAPRSHTTDPLPAGQCEDYELFPPAPCSPRVRPFPHVVTCIRVQYGSALCRHIGSNSRESPALASSQSHQGEPSDGRQSILSLLVSRDAVEAMESSARPLTRLVVRLPFVLGSLGGFPPPPFGSRPCQRAVILVLRFHGSRTCSHSLLFPIITTLSYSQRPPPLPATITAHSAVFCPCYTFTLRASCKTVPQCHGTCP